MILILSIIHIIHINNLRRNNEYGYEYLLSLTAFSVNDMIYLHLSDRIDYSKLEKFPMIRKNIIWLIHQGSIGNRSLKYDKSEWKELLKPYWDEDHKEFESKINDILGDD